MRLPLMLQSTAAVLLGFFVLQVVWQDGSIGTVDAAATSWGWLSRAFGGNPNGWSSSSAATTTLFTLDPSALLSTLVDRGGLFLPDYIDKDLMVMRNAIHCAQAQLNLFSRTFVLTNFTIGLKRGNPLMRIGRTKVHWDSYTDPVLSIEVDDVDVSVEFTNLLLTQNNWNSLTAIGFPPHFEPTKKAPTKQTTKPPTSQTAADSWIRIASVDVSGNVTLRISSKPLSRDLGFLTYDMRALRGLTAELKRQSKLNYVETGRLGLTVAGLESLLETYFLQQAKEFVLAHADTIIMAAAADPKDIWRSGVQYADRMVNKASGVISEYAIEAVLKHASDSFQGSSGSNESEWSAKFDKAKSWLNKLKERIQDTNPNP